MMNVIYWRSLVWKKFREIGWNPSLAPSDVKNMEKIKVLKKEPLRSKLNKKITEFPPTNYYYYYTQF